MTPDDVRHGTRNGYRAGCRDTCCTNANQAYNTAYYETYRDYLGYQPLVDSTPVLERLDELARLHISPSAIAQTVGVDDSAIRYLYDNRPTVVQQATYDRLADLQARNIITALGLSRRVRALTAIGWPVSHLVRETGLDKEPLRRLRDGDKGYVQAHVKAAVLDAYDRLHMAGPVITDTPTKRAVTRALNTAKANRWAPPLAWEHIDDPLEVPAVAAPVTYVRVDLDEFAYLTRAGEHPERAATRLGVTLSGVENAAKKQGRIDLWELAKNARLQQRRTAA